MPAYAADASKDQDAFKHQVPNKPPWTCSLVKVFREPTGLGPPKQVDVPPWDCRTWHSPAVHRLMILDPVHLLSPYQDALVQEAWDRKRG